MNEYFILFNIVTPAIVLAIGWGAVLLHEWDGRRQSAQSNDSSPPKQP